MPRANRHFLPGRLWHITHRCHERTFLLKFARDRRAWLGWLFEAKATNSGGQLRVGPEQHADFKLQHPENQSS